MKPNGVVFRIQDDDGPTPKVFLGELNEDGDLIGNAFEIGDEQNRYSELPFSKVQFVHFTVPYHDEDIAAYQIKNLGSFSIYNKKGECSVESTNQEGKFASIVKYIFNTET